MRGGRAAVVLAAVVAVVLLVVLTARAVPDPPYDPDSPAPLGYGALRELVERNGGTLSTAAPSELRTGDGGIPDSILAALPSRLSEAEQEVLRGLAARGATVVLGTPDSAPDPLQFGVLGDRELADTEARPVPPGACTIDELADLGDIDVAFAFEQYVPPGARSCYGTPDHAFVVAEAVGEGRIVTLADPVLWSNARLQPAKELGGQPLDNAAMALRLLLPRDGAEVVVVGTTASPGSSVTGVRDPVELLPLPVKLALLQGAVAVLLWLWWRGRRLGRPVTEPLPVRISASELVEAVGDLHRRRGSAARAAATMRADLRRELSTRLGIPPGAPVEVLVERVASAAGRPDDEVRSLLSDPSPPRREDLAALAAQLDSIRQEVLDDQPVR